MPEITADVEALCETLGDRGRAVPARSFDRQHVDVDAPGLYAWWADGAAVAMLAVALGREIGPLVYAGQAGATRQPSGSKSSATLGDRIGRNHIAGNIGSSTFRKTLAAVLAEPLGLRVNGKGALTRSSNVALSRWISEHLSVVVVTVTDRDQLGAIEPMVIRALDPPFNLDHVDPTPMRARIRELRGLLKVPPVGEPASHDSDSSTQREAERRILDWVEKQVKAKLGHRVIGLPNGSKVDVDGFSERPLILVEAFARQGALLGGQRHKVAADALKLITVQRLIYPNARLALAFASPEAAAWVQGNTWLGEAIRSAGIEIFVAELEEGLRQQLLGAQARQKMVNATGANS